METVNHTSNGNEKVTHTRNSKLEQKLLSNRNIYVAPLAMKPGIDQGIVLIVLAPKMLLASATKEVVADVGSGGAGLTGLHGN